MFRSLTSSGVSVLKALLTGPMPKADVIKKLWPASASFFMRIPDALEEDGLLKIATAGAVCELTDAGRDALSRRVWVCEYCIDEFFGVKAGRRLSESSCKACSGTHVVCKACRRHLIAVGGEFPAYKMLLRECPSPGVRILVLMKRSKKSKVDSEKML